MNLSTYTDVPDGICILVAEVNARIQRSMKLSTLRTLLLAVIGLSYLTGFLIIDNWKTTIYYGDTSGYYIHVVSAFVNQDIGDYDKTIRGLRTVNPNSPDPRDDKFGIRLTDKGKRYIKYTVGVSVMEAPFFWAAHLYTKATGKYEANGWTRPYAFAIGISTSVYLLIGFYFLITVLAKYFEKRIVALVILSLAFATNVFFHATYVTMAHGFLFFDYCLLLYLTMRYHEKPGLLRAFGIGTIIGLITLTRVPEIISALIPALWGVATWQSLKQRTLSIASHFKYLVTGGAGFVLVFSLQIAYWYYVSGHLVFNPYEGEGFNFLKPKILNGWFHFSNGWLIYTPIMIFSVIGVFLLYKYHRTLPLCIIAFVCVHIWIHYSYYAWSYYPGFGSRPMVETYPALAFGLAAAYLFCDERKWLRWLPITALVLFTILNLFQSWQSRQGIIWTERGSKAFYLETFGKLKFSVNALRAFDSRQIQPDESNLELVATLASNSFEDSTTFATSHELSNTGEVSVFDASEYLHLQPEMPLSDLQAGDWLKFGISGYIKDEDKIHIRDNLAQLVVETIDPDSERRHWIGTKISAYLGNDQGSIWSTGDGYQWDEASFYMRIPKRKLDYKIKVFVLNPHGQKIYLDDFFIQQYRKKR